MTLRIHTVGRHEIGDWKERNEASDQKLQDADDVFACILPCRELCLWNHQAEPALE